MTQSKYRAKRYNEKNLVLEEWMPPARIERGRHVGQMSEGNWKVIGYYRNISQLVTALINDKIELDLGLDKSFKQEVLDAIDRATKYVVSNLTISEK